MEQAQAARDMAQRQVAETQGQVELLRRRAEQAEDQSKGVGSQIETLTARLAEKEAALNGALATFSQVSAYV